jgi:hypothetical protein
MKKLSLIVFASIFFIFSCKEEELPADLIVKGTLAANPNLFFTSSILNGANEAPANTSTASGTANGTYNKTTKALDLTITYKDLTPTNWHIHKAAVGVSGGVVFGIPTAEFKSPFVYKTPAALTDAQETDLLAGLYYVNIHSAKNPGGEIRGQIPFAISKATGWVDGSYNPNTKLLTLQVNYADITPTAWHVHKGADTENGPVVLDLGSTFNTGYNYISPPLTAEQEADLKAGKMYLNIHSARAPSGEIRGQILVQ